MSTNFWNAVCINSKNPHIINKRVCGVKFIHSYFRNTKCLCAGNDFQQILSFSGEYSTIKNSIEQLEDIEEFEFDWGTPIDKRKRSVLNIRKLFPKTGSSYYWDVELLCFQHAMVTYYAIDCQRLSVWYQLFEKENSVHLKISSESSKECNWLQSILLPKIRKWYASTHELCGMKSNDLVDNEEYQTLYQKLKIKYGNQMVKIWPECTDPSKFVFEDVGIAAYLILLWKQEREEKNISELQSFIDLGCGNGLLVFILASEGHPGRGIDIRSRKIWELYPLYVKLEVGVVSPNSEDFHADWLIGNHSDELTPWLPVFAAKFHCSYFVLPCCAFTFFGKFQNSKGGSDLSKYQCYLNFVEKIGKMCGFHVRKDRLKIPSTRRICFAGTEREKRVTQDKIDYFIKSCLPKDVSIQDVDWDSYFVARDAIEPVRNCTKIDESIKTRVVTSVAKYLLDNSSNYAIIGSKKWNKGKTVELSELVNLISKEDLSCMKNEFGGLQTLLKNHSHVFLVRQGTVRFRAPFEMSVTEYRESRGSKKQKLQHTWKKKECWFLGNHPNGCPCSDEECRYSHVVR